MLHDVDDETKTGGGSHDDAAPDRDELKPGGLLTLKEEKAAKLLGRMWSAHEPHMKRRLAEWRVNTLRRAGIPGVARVKGAGDNDWDVWLAPGVTGPDQIPTINKAAEIARKFVAILLADPFKPQVIPAGTSEKEVISAQVATRVLEQVEGESGLSEEHTIRKAFNKASDYGSGFVHYYVDPKGGPRVPVQIEAHPTATHEDMALTDPMTGEDAAPPYIKKFVLEDGTLSDKPEGARMRDLPALRREVLTGRNVRFVPHTAEDLWDAEGVLIGTFVPVIKLRQRFPEVMEKLEKNEDEFQKVLGYRPENSRSIAARGQELSVPDLERPETVDDAMIFVLTGYFRKSGDYPSGCVIITLGNCEVAHREDWSFIAEDGTEEVLEIPVTQYAQFDEGDDEPYYHGIMTLIGAANEMRNAQAASIVDMIERMANRKTYLPLSSMLSEEDLENPNKRYIPIADGSQPYFEQPPQVPQDIWHWFNDIGTEMDRAPGLSETVQGLESPSVKSGRQALAIAQQAHAALSVVKGHLMRGYERSGRVKLQLMRAFFDAPQSFLFEEDEAFKLEEWRGADLGGARDVRVAPGSGTMLTPAAKAQLAEHWFSLGLIPPDDMQRISSANIGPILGMQTDPHRIRIQRQLWQWMKGPPEDWAPQPPQPQQDPTTGQTIMVPAPDPVLAKIFEPVAADMMPAIAQKRIDEIARTMSSERYLAKPPQWRQALEQEFQRMSMAVTQSMMPSPTSSGPDMAQAMSQSGSPKQQGQAGDQVGMDTDPGANSSVRLSEGEVAQAGGAF